MASTTEREGHADGRPDEEERDGAMLARILDESARGLVDRPAQESVEHTVGLIVRGAIHTIPHVEQAGVSLVERGGTVDAYAPSNDAVRELDELQTEIREGPCLESIWSEQRSVVDDMEIARERWPRYADAALARGFRSLMAFQLFADRGSAGALNLYAASPHAFDESSADAGALFAAQAALALHGAKRVAGLTVALDSRDVIGQAKGILMERFGVGPEQAFSMLVESSQQTNMKLVGVATWLVDEVRKRNGRDHLPEGPAGR
ncbi:GAF domain-containing protein [Actinomycetospora succinea]|uniref:GAF domain-containing protein n=1 Tax=Actinomycetospora succinea TaxID=663603 RepID=A0A4R6V2A4_9PSEU|nr:ANTAR domain-containing protein [Actinomycetospora succinea]TDQ52743.1 GAF domain-containing protein [Actinomycetospora succinea]